MEPFILIESRESMSKIPLGFLRMGEEVRYDGVSVRLGAILEFVGIEVRKDPGVPVVWAAFAVILLGLLLAFGRVYAGGPCHAAERDNKD